MVWPTRNSNNSERRSHGYSISAVLLIGLGLVFLLNNFGVLSWNLWDNLWKFWPILLVLFGIEMIIGKAPSFKGLGILLVLIFLLPILLILNPLTGNPLATTKQSFSESLGSTTRAKISFELSSANIKISSVEDGSTALYKGEIKYSNLLPKPVVKIEKHFGEGSFTFTQGSPEPLPFLNNLGNSVSFQLTNLVPLEIKTSSLSGVINLDLSKLRVEQVEVGSSTGSVTINFAADYSTKVFVKTGASLVKLTIPSEVAASIKTDSSIKTINIDTKRFPLTGSLYKSGNFDSNQFKVEVEISGQATSVEVK